MREAVPNWRPGDAYDAVHDSQRTTIVPRYPYAGLSSLSLLEFWIRITQSGKDRTRLARALPREHWAMAHITAESSITRSQMADVRYLSRQCLVGILIVVMMQG
eukprot:3140896-Rhodomonas_salina.5